MKYGIFGVAIAALGLAGCGGGGDDGSAAPPATTTTTTTTPTVPSTGTVSANFVQSTSPAPAVLVGVGSQNIFKASQVVQTNGAVTTVGDYVLSGTSTATKDIAGDATFAMGRWVQGNVTKAGVAVKKLEGTSSNDFYHYLVMNALPAIPASGTKTCDAGKFTTPSLTSGSATSALVAMGTSTAQISLSSAGATVALKLNVAGTATNFSVFISNPASNSFAGGLGGNQSGAAIALGDGGNGAIRLGGSFQTLLQNGSTYQGVYTFLCS